MGRSGASEQCEGQHGSECACLGPSAGEPDPASRGEHRACRAAASGEEISRACAMPRTMKWSAIKYAVAIATAVLVLLADLNRCTRGYPTSAPA